MRLDKVATHVLPPRADAVAGIIDFMEWIGKLVGGALGFVVLGPAGSLLGVLLGHQVDAGRLGFPVTSAAGIQRLFFEVTFEVMGHVAKLDGRVSEHEVRIARRIMHGMHLSPAQVRSAIERFTAGKRADYPRSQRVGELGRAFGGRQDLARTFIQIQLQAAIGSGDFTAAKRGLLWQIAQTLGVGRAEFAQLEALVRSQGRGGHSAPTPSLSLEDAYRSLSIDDSASDHDVKKAYRRLMNQHHPDKLVSRGLPESMIEVAEQRTHEIRAAYERIKAHRGFK